jgi:GH18 family chitinase
MTRRQRTLAAFGVLVAVVVVAGLVLGGALRPAASGQATTGPGSGASGGASSDSGVTATTPEPTPVPTPGHETYGFLPYWEMDDTIAAHVAETDLSTLALFSVSNRANGTIDTSQRGYQQISGPIGRQLIREAHDRHTRVELVFTSFGKARNKRVFGAGAAAETRRAKLVPGLVDLAGELGVDGINVDVEVIDDALIPTYGTFVEQLRSALKKAQPKAQLSVATTANVRGAAMAAAATLAGADRIFMMGYDYHYAGSAPGASSPMARRDGSEKDLVWSLDLYESVGVPVQKTILGLPLYGMSWPVTGPELGAPQTGTGTNWFPSANVDFLRDPANVAVLDDIEVVEQYTIPSSGPERTPDPSAGPVDWTAIYVDSPATLTPKMALADARGLAGVGFWAIGYERGLPGYTALIRRFHEGKLE